jgi:hypothetical protein
MTEETLADSISTALGPDIQIAVKEMSSKIANENGAEDAAVSFHNIINVDSMRCLILPDRIATWRMKSSDIRLSTLAASVLIDHGIISLAQLKL